jgi:hypothetical protein
LNLRPSGYEPDELTTALPRYGGDEGSRTPVHNTFHIVFYRFSQVLLIRLLGGLASSIQIEIGL